VHVGCASAAFAHKRHSRPTLMNMPRRIVSSRKGDRNTLASECTTEVAGTSLLKLRLATLTRMGGACQGRGLNCFGNSGIISESGATPGGLSSESGISGQSSASGTGHFIAGVQPHPYDQLMLVPPTDCRVTVKT
jgi:hypothetical protein